MIADTPDELHQMAKMIGLKMKWYQRTSIPHYDLTESMRDRAILNGAEELERTPFVDKVREIRSGIDNDTTFWGSPEHYQEKL